MRTNWTVLLMMLLIACSCTDNKGRDYEPELTSLLETAGNKNLHVTYRLKASLKADSLALAVGDTNGHIESLQYTSTLYLKMDSTELARKYLFTLLSSFHPSAPDTLYAVAMNNLGSIYHEQSNYDSALACYQTAQAIFTLRKDTLRAAQSFLNIGIAYKDKTVFDRAFTNTLTGIRMLQTLNRQKDLATAYSTMGNILKEFKRYQEALQYHIQALDIRTAEKDSTGIAASLNNIGNVYRHKKELKNALDFYIRSYEIKSRTGRKKALATALDNIAETYLEQKNHEYAQQYFRKAILMRKASGDLMGELSTASRLAHVFFSAGNLAEAKKTALDVWERTPASGEWQQKLSNNLLLYKIYVAEGNDRAAHKFADNALALKDSLFNKDIAETISRMNVRFQTNEKIRELGTAKRLQQLSIKQIRGQKYFILSLVLFLVVLAVIVYLLNKSNHQKKIANRRVEMLMAELNHRVKNNLQLIADMLYLQESEEGSDATLIQGIRSRVQSMNIIQGFLYKKEYDGTIPVKAFLESLMDNIKQVNNNSGVSPLITLSSDDISLPVDQAITLGIIINELITNFYKYNQEFRTDAYLQVSFQKQDLSYHLNLRDNGQEWDSNQAMTEHKGFGLTLVNILTEQLGGSWKISHSGSGTAHFIIFK